MLTQLFHSLSRPACCTSPAPRAEGWKLVTLLRLSPIAPWNVLNYALSVTAVPLAAYFLASALAVSDSWSERKEVGVREPEAGAPRANYVLI